RERFMSGVTFISRIVLTFSLLSLIATQAAAQSKMVEGIGLRGYRTVSREELLKRIRNELGKPFSERRAQGDFERLMKMGVFDELKSKLFVEDGSRGGKVVIFFLHESPKEK